MMNRRATLKGVFASVAVSLQQKIRKGDQVGKDVQLSSSSIKKLKANGDDQRLWTTFHLLYDNLQEKQNVISEKMIPHLNDLIVSLQDFFELFKSNSDATHATMLLTILLPVIDRATQYIINEFSKDKTAKSVQEKIQRPGHREYDEDSDDESEDTFYSLREGIEAATLDCRSLLQKQHQEHTSCIPNDHETSMHKIDVIQKNIQNALDYLIGKQHLDSGSLVELKRLLEPVIFQNDIRRHSKTYFAGSRMWLFDEFSNWLDSSKAEKAEAKQQINRIFWLQAGAGMGKTVFAAKLCQQLNAEDRLLGCVFFKFSDHRASNPSTILKSLVFQIAERYPVVQGWLLDVLRADQESALPAQSTSKPEYQEKKSKGAQRLSTVVQAARKFGNTSSKRLQYIFDNYLLGILKQLEVHLLSNTKAQLELLKYPRVLVIDALDESGPEFSVRRIEFLKLFSKANMNKLPSWVRMFVTGRPETDIKKALNDFNPTCIEESDPRHLIDLEDYLRKSLQEVLSRLDDADQAQVNSDVAASQKIHNQNQSLLASQSAPIVGNVATSTKHGSQILEILVRKLLYKSEGKFLYTSVLHGHLEDYIARWKQDDQRKDKVITLQIFEKLLNELPDGVDECYYKTFKRMLDSPTMGSVVKPFLQCMVASPIPLSAELVRYLIGFDDPNKVNNWKVLKRGMIAMFPLRSDGNSGVETPSSKEATAVATSSSEAKQNELNMPEEDVRFYPCHKSVVDWLTDKTRSTNLYIDPFEAHQMVAMRLLRSSCLGIIFETKAFSEADLGKMTSMTSSVLLSQLEIHLYQEDSIKKSFQANAPSITENRSSDSKCHEIYVMTTVAQNGPIARRQRYAIRYLTYHLLECATINMSRIHAETKQAKNFANENIGTTLTVRTANIDSSLWCLTMIHFLWTHLQWLQLSVALYGPQAFVKQIEQIFSIKRIFPKSRANESLYSSITLFEDIHAILWLLKFLAPLSNSCQLGWFTELSIQITMRFCTHCAEPDGKLLEAPNQAITSIVPQDIPVYIKNHLSSSSLLPRLVKQATSYAKAINSWEYLGCTNPGNLILSPTSSVLNVVQVAAAIRFLVVLSQNIIVIIYGTTISLWSTAFGDFTMLTEISTALDIVSCCKISENLFATGSSVDNKISVWQIAQQPEGDSPEANSGDAMTTNSFDEDCVCIREWSCPNAIQSLTCMEIPTTGADGKVVSKPVIASGSADRILRFWNIQTGLLELSIEDNQAIMKTLCPVAQFAVSTSDQKLISGSRLATNADGDKIRIFNIGTNSCEKYKTLEGHIGEVKSLCLLPHGYMASGAVDYHIHIFSLASVSNICVEELKGHDGVITGLCPIVVPAKVLVGNQQKHNHDTKHAATANQGTNEVFLLASASQDKTVRIWRLGCIEVNGGNNDGRKVHKSHCLRVLESDIHAISHICHLADSDANSIHRGGRLVSVSNSTIRVWNLAEVLASSHAQSTEHMQNANRVNPAANIDTSMSHQQNIQSLHQLTDGRWLTAGKSPDMKMRMWKLIHYSHKPKRGKNTEPVKEIEDQHSEVTCQFVFDPCDGEPHQFCEVMFTSTVDTANASMKSSVTLNTTSTIPLQIMVSVDEYDQFDQRGNNDALSPGKSKPLQGPSKNHFLIAGLSNGNVQLWDVATGKTIAIMSSEGAIETALPSSPNKTIQQFGRPSTAQTGGQRSSQIYQTSVDKSITIITKLSVQTNNLDQPVERSHDDGSNGIFATGSANGMVHIWNAATQRCEQVLKGHEQPVTAIIPLATNKSQSICNLFASASEDKTIIIWGINDLLPQNCLDEGRFACKKVFHGHTQAVMSMCQIHSISSVSLITTEIIRIASVSMDKTLRVWNFDPMATMNKPKPGEVEWERSISFPSYCSDAMISIWEVNTPSSFSPVKRPTTSGMGGRNPLSPDRFRNTFTSNYTPPKSATGDRRSSLAPIASPNINAFSSDSIELMLADRKGTLHSVLMYNSEEPEWKICNSAAERFDSLKNVTMNDVAAIAMAGANQLSSELFLFEHNLQCAQRSKTKKNSNSGIVVFVIQKDLVFMRDRKKDNSH